METMMKTTLAIGFAAGLLMTITIVRAQEPQQQAAAVGRIARNRIERGSPELGCLIECVRGLAARAADDTQGIRIPRALPQRALLRCPVPSASPQEFLCN